jgi:hypothetical protein
VSPLLVLGIILGSISFCVVLVVGVIGAIGYSVYSVGSEIGKVTQRLDERSDAKQQVVDHQQKEALAAAALDRKAREREPVQNAIHALQLLDQPDDIDLKRVANWMEGHSFQRMPPTQEDKLLGPALKQAALNCEQLKYCFEVKHCNQVAYDWTQRWMDAEKNYLQRQDELRRRAIDAAAARARNEEKRLRDQEEQARRRLERDLERLEHGGLSRPR